MGEIVYKQYYSEESLIKRVFALLLLIGIIAVGIILNWNFIKLLFVNQTKPAQTTSSTIKDAAKPTAISNTIVPLGTKTIKILPGQSDQGK